MLKQAREEKVLWHRYNFKAYGEVQRKLRRLSPPARKSVPMMQKSLGIA